MTAKPTPKEIIAKTRVDFLGEAGETVATLVIAALNKAGYKIVHQDETEQMLERIKSK